MTVKAIKEQAESLTAEERRELADWLADRVAADEPPVLSDEMKAELARRIAEADANPGDRTPWEIVLAESLARARP